MCAGKIGKGHMGTLCIIFATSCESKIISKQNAFKKSNFTETTQPVSEG